MAEQPTVTTPGGSDLFAGLGSIDYSSFSDDAMTMLVEENLSTSTGRTPTFKTGLTPGGANTNTTERNPNEPFMMTPRTVEFMSELAASTPANQSHASPSANMTMMFDHEMVTNGMDNGRTPTSQSMPSSGMKDEEDDEDGDAADLPTPLTFSMNGPASSGARYHVAATHKHKRVRSNPDMLQTLNYQQLMGANAGTTSTSPLRPSVGETSSLPSGSTSLPTTPLDGNAPYDPSMPAPLPISIGTVNVVTPVGFHATNDDTGTTNDTFPSDMDSFLKEMQWSELAENNNSMNVDTLSDLGAGYRSQRIQAGMNELKMKRKRPTQHMRHHSNPVELLHNLDQFRLLSQQQQQSMPPQPQQQQYTPPPSPPLPVQFPSPTKVGGMVPMQQGPPPSGMTAMPQPMMIAPNPFAMQPGMPMMQDVQFQVPTDIANGTARSLHARRSSMPNSAFGRGRGGGHRRATARGSTGLSMDMSQLNLEFLSLPEDEFQQQLQQQRQQQAFQQAMGGTFPSPPPSPPLQNFQQQLQTGFGMGMVEPEAEKNRKSYKCGRCGKPKVGHVCTMPDLRNNWTQADIEVTKGIKIVRTNVHIVATKNKWIPQHEDNL